MALLASIGEWSVVAADDDSCASLNNPYNRPDGQLIQYGSTIYLVEGCEKRGFTDTIALTSHRFDGTVRIISAAENSAFNAVGSGPILRAREGTVLRSPTGSRYIVDEVSRGSYQLRFVGNTAWAEMFEPCGTYPVIDVSSTYIQSYAEGPAVLPGGPRPDGQLIRNPAGTIFLLVGGNKRGFPEPSSLLSYNFNQPTCNVSQAEADRYPTGANLRAREGTLFKDDRAPVYVMNVLGSSYQKRHITSPDAFNYYGYSSSAIRTWSRSVVDGYDTGPHAHPYKTLFSVGWYKSLVTNDLSMHREYIGTTQGSWDAQITGARDSWNGAPIAPDFVEVNYNVNNDVHVRVEHLRDDPRGGFVDFRYDANGKVRRVIVYLNAYFAPSQALVAHELGHVLLLAHDGLDPDTNGDGLDEVDNACGGARVPRTIMDYDCLAYFSGPVNWDSCGVNHKHATGAWSGC